MCWSEAILRADLAPVQRSPDGERERRDVTGRVVDVGGSGLEGEAEAGRDRVGEVGDGLGLDAGHAAQHAPVLRVAAQDSGHDVRQVLDAEPDPLLDEVISTPADQPVGEGPARAEGAPAPRGLPGAGEKESQHGPARETRPRRSSRSGGTRRPTREQPSFVRGLSAARPGRDARNRNPWSGFDFREGAKSCAVGTPYVRERARGLLVRHHA
jgi:hypothetical protein